MDRFRQFLRTKGLYIAIGAGVLAFVGLMVIYNYNSYKREFGIGEQTVDLNAPEVTEDTEVVAETKVEEPQVTETNSKDALAGATDAQEADATDTAGTNATNNAAGTNVTDTAGTNTTDTAGANIADAAGTNTTDAAGADATDTAGTTGTGDEKNQEVAETDSDGVIVNEDGVVVANSYNEGTSLVWPVEGTVILPFSMDTTVYFKTLKSYRCNPGMLISAKEGENVLAAYEGVVESVSDDAEHGTTVTINMGNGYKAYYGQLMNVTVSKGDTIATAQNIGEAAAPSSYYSEEGTHIFFELTKNDVPINPNILMQ